MAGAIDHRLGPGYEYLFVTAPEDLAAVQNRIPDDRLYVVPMPSSSGLVSLRQKVAAVPRSFWHAAHHILQLRPHVILCLGTCLAIPLFLIGRMLVPKRSSLKASPGSRNYRERDGWS